MNELTVIKILLIVLLNFSISYMLLEKYMLKQIAWMRDKRLRIKMLGLSNYVAVGIFGIPMYIAIELGYGYLTAFVRGIAIAVCSPLFAVYFALNHFEK